MKNSYKITFLSLLIIFFLFSCKKEPSIKVINFPKSIELEGIPLGIKTYFPKQILIQDSLLVVLNKKGDYIFQVFDTKTMNLLGQFGNIGRGPGEFNEASFINQKVTSSGRVFDIVYDGVNNRLNYINPIFNLSLKNPISFMNVPKEHIGADRFVFFSDSLSISTLGYGGRFNIKTRNKSRIIGYLPELSYPIHKENFYPVYANKSSLLNVKKSKFVATTTLLGQYDFFDLSGNLLYSKIIERDKNLKNLVSSYPLDYNKLITYHTEIKEYNSLIYSLFLKINLKKDISLLKSKIQIFDWDGNPQKEYLLDGFITSFAYDSINNCFYGLETSKSEYEIIKYSLK